MSLDRFLFSYAGVGGGSGPGNLITQQDLSNPYWTLSGFTVAPVNNISEIATTSGHTFGLTTGLPRPVGTGTFMHTVDLVKIGPDERWMGVGIFSIGLGSGAIAFFDILTGVVNAQQAYGGFAVPTATIAPIPGGFRCSVTSDCRGSAFAGITILDQDTTPEGTFTYAGNVSDGYTVSNLNLFQIS